MQYLLGNNLFLYWNMCFLFAASPEVTYTYPHAITMSRTLWVTCHKFFRPHKQSPPTGYFTLLRSQTLCPPCHPQSDYSSSLITSSKKSNKIRSAGFIQIPALLISICCITIMSQTRLLRPARRAIAIPRITYSTHGIATLLPRAL